MKAQSHPTTTDLKSLLNKRAVLCVDDDPDQHYILKRFFTGFDLSLAFASSAEQALPMLQSQHFDLLILDVMMPGMDGWTLYSHIRLIDALQKLPVLFLTCVMERQHESRMKDIGAHCMSLAKPVTPERLTRALTTLLS